MLKKNKPNNIMRFITAFCLVSILLFFGYVFSNISIGGHISKESYYNNGVLDEDSWIWNLMIFLAIMWTWCSIFSELSDWFDIYWGKDKALNNCKHKRRKKNG